MNPYEILDIKEDATDKDIKKAYRDLSKIWHPDVNNGRDANFKKIHIAYKVLSDPDKRRLYDEQGVVMDESPDHMKTMVRERLSIIATQWVDGVLKGNKTDIRTFFTKNINEGMVHIRRNTKEIEKAIGGLTDIYDRLSHTSGDSIVHKVIKQRISTLKKGSLQNVRELEMIEKIREEILKYDYKMEEQEKVVHEYFTFTTTL